LCRVGGDLLNRHLDAGPAPEQYASGTGNNFDLPLLKAFNILRSSF
jgi:hypothetical protein